MILREKHKSKQINLNQKMAGQEVNALGHPALKPKSPVPSDIEISQDIVRSVGLAEISEVAKQYVVLRTLSFACSVYMHGGCINFHTMW